MKMYSSNRKVPVPQSRQKFFVLVHELAGVREFWRPLLSKVCLNKGMKKKISEPAGATVHRLAAARADMSP